MVCSVRNMSWESCFVEERRGRLLEERSTSLTFLANGFLCAPTMLTSSGGSSSISSSGTTTITRLARDNTRFARDEIFNWKNFPRSTEYRDLLKEKDIDQKDLIKSNSYRRTLLAYFASEYLEDIEEEEE